MSDAYTIEDVVNVTITLGDRPISQANFSTPLLLVETGLAGVGEPFENTRVLTYTSTTAMTDDGFLSTDPAYKMAEKIFGGDNPPTQIKIADWDQTGLETFATAIADVINTDSEWFFLLTDLHTNADVLAAAAWAEANKRMYIVSLQDADILTATPSNTLDDLQTLQYDNTFVFVHQDADTEFVEGGIIGAMAGLTPGTSTLHGKTLPGVASTTFTRTESDNVTSQNGNVYPQIASVGFFLEGNVVSGRYFDVIRGALYLEARMEEDIFAFIKRESDLGRKIPYTDNGVAMIEAVMYSRLQTSVDQGFLASSPRPKVFPPLVADVSAVDKAARLLPDVPFEATLAGAIHTVTIRGYVSV